jgi:hypothetical protein
MLAHIRGPSSSLALILLAIYPDTMLAGCSARRFPSASRPLASLVSAGQCCFPPTERPHHNEMWPKEFWNVSDNET